MQVAFYLAGEITQVKESIPWVRCASGNVYDISPAFVWETFTTTPDEEDDNNNDHEHKILIRMVHNNHNNITIVLS